MKTIYNTYVVMESQEQCDRMKQLCIDNGLPIWDDEEYPDLAFALFDLSKNFKWNTKEFLVGYSTDGLTQVTEQEFIELLNQNL